MQLSQKEIDLIKDNLEHEKVCVATYQNYANNLQDPQLKGLFNDLAQKEQQHINMLNQLLQQQF
ncbi:MAG: hypothetical protein PWQ82_965 [Thermosediminibacterales bacterium]|nr:hypothetical protein [Thermosediminibacterales bacterium]